MRVPYDEQAEEEVVGMAVATRHGAQLAGGRLVGDDFYKPAHRRAFTAARRVVFEDQDERVAAVAVAAEMDVDVVARLVEQRSAMFDSGGVFAGRVKRAAQKRHAMEALAEAFNALGDGAELDEVTPLLEVVR